jgi:hypothetical protein
MNEKEIWLIGIEGASFETFKRVQEELNKYKTLTNDEYIIVPHNVSSIRLK